MGQQHGTWFERFTDRFYADNTMGQRKGIEERSKQRGDIALPHDIELPASDTTRSKARAVSSGRKKARRRARGKSR
jgi:hypothetical protein